ncbi:D-hexose-6-phosphate mutarotase [Bifidobacterium olomucense]|uniref:Putative glucose-6-phosphate 1-epimerase n=1 Tax=Bifidobacterium olomucense TaxID=2675324 RepID=A0A7Y0EWN9_9BIFI|nr:D-hexose-6-phosphate mutarotase [Bifidobacterium sp. DSM 109959]NMM97810.1 D-hexose-6-phosphate mutarotase [Bifidobacterium sp. DSM 109959]
MNGPFVIRRIGDSTGEATVSDHGAHVLRWAPAGSPDVVWQPKSIFLKSDKAIRGGIPIIFPWFNSGYDISGFKRTPKHGFARISLWQAADSTDTSLRYVLDSQAIDEQTLEQFYGNAHPQFHAEVNIAAGETLTVALTVTNTGDAGFAYEAALHTYLHVGNALQARVHGLDGSHFLDATLPDFPVARQEGDATFAGDLVDRIYLTDNPLELIDPALGRTIAISSAGATGTVVWNPGEIAGNAIGDLDEGEWRDFVCVEAVANRERLINLAPGESHTLAQTLSVK